MKLPSIQRGMLNTTLGSIFYLMSDGRNPATTATEKPPILCFHMSPRSSDEYLEILPLLALGNEENNDDRTGGGRAVIAFDIPGYGASENPPRSCTIDEISDAFLNAADSILEEDGSCTNYVTVGSLMGNYFCVSLASRYPERIKAGILTNPWFNPDVAVASESKCNDGAPIEESFVLEDDGSHLVGLHSKRSGWLNPELNFRVVHSEIAYLANRRVRYPKGIYVQGGNDYHFQTPVQTIVEQRSDNSDNACQFLCITGDACASLFDRFGLEGTKRFDEACKLLLGPSDGDGSSSAVKVKRLEGDKSTLNLVNQMPEEFAALCNNFLSERGL